MHPPAAERHALEHSETRLDSLQQELQAARTAYHQVAEQLRRNVPWPRSNWERVTQALSALGMPHGQFCIVLERLEKPTAAAWKAWSFR